MMVRKVLAPAIQRSIEELELNRGFAVWASCMGHVYGFIKARDVYIPDGVPYAVEKGIYDNNPAVYVNDEDAGEVVVVEYTASTTTTWCEFTISDGNGNVLAYEEDGTLRQMKTLLDTYAEGMERFGWDNTH